MNTLNNLSIKKILKCNLNLKTQLINLIRSENGKSILSKIADDIIYQYLDIAASSLKIDLFFCFNRKELIGYAILAKKPIYLISEFKSLKYKIFFNLLVKGNFLIILDLILAILKLDIFKLKKINKELLNDNLNLNLIAINKNFQSKGIGKFFLMEIISIYKKEKRNRYICCETFSSKAEKFYTDKLGFKNIGEKFRFSGKLQILKKTINPI